MLAAMSEIVCGIDENKKKRELSVDAAGKACVICGPPGASRWKRSFFSGSTTPALASVQMIGSGPGTVRRLFISTKVGTTRYVGLSDSADALEDGDVPQCEFSINTSTATRLHDFGESGQYFPTGICLTISSSQQNFVAATTVTNITVLIEYVLDP